MKLFLGPILYAENQTDPEAWSFSVNLLLSGTDTAKPPPLRLAFRDATRDVYAKWKKSIGEDLVNKAEAAIAGRDETLASRAKPASRNASPSAIIRGLAERHRGAGRDGRYTMALRAATAAAARIPS